ncbi:2-amino-4-hydroxy-6-hydroxymethyldihydropteridine diphosphokinase [Rhodocyclus purpureus]|uniref:2-amino-4-hydroxy-6- hydroxymethyldihydropteridine diphosphokinase n=1 Tax=Rhodocyclus purpureus TaxID=1067 RepID=UPI0019124216|nr:2-amino-4-hydroxy-6-hydroxymethyldihydropteridine diphosphokinase [Rhodocyclus purpureus]MBK5915733.1 2-amino-4-hydroxy-6-hydroxymethyldihydropteridine diphosphokinase [Rhodocyclus purpureus]
MTDTHRPHRAFVALGANLDEPAAQVKAAAAALAALPGSRLLRLSSLYRSAPVGVGAEAQPDYVNAVAELATGLGAHELLAELFAIEQRFGRRRSTRNAARTLDLDLLLFDGQCIDDAVLTLPHPRLHLRAFVVQPLVEIAPELSIPRRGLAAAWLPAVASQRIERMRG